MRNFTTQQPAKLTGGRRPRWTASRRIKHCRHADTQLRELVIESCSTGDDLVMVLVADLLDGRVRRPPAGVEPIAWFKGVLRGRARRVARSQQRFVQLDACFAALAADRPTDADDLIEVRCGIAAAMDKLGVRQREIARRYWLEGWRAPEIAQDLGISLSTVWTHLYRAAKHLRAALAPLQRRDAA